MSKTLDLVSLAQSIGVAVGAINDLQNKAEALREAANKNIAAMHNAKAKVGTYRKDGTGCALATAFIDGCISANVSAGTAQKVYLPTFKAHVASGKPVTDWNLQRAKKKAAQAAAQGSGKTLAQKLATAFRDEGFESFLQDLTASFENAEIDSLHEGIENYLILNGALKEDEGK